MRKKGLAWLGECGGRSICRANMTDVTIPVYRLSSGFLGMFQRTLPLGKVQLKMAVAKDLQFSHWGVSPL